MCIIYHLGTPKNKVGWTSFKVSIREPYEEKFLNKMTYTPYPISHLHCIRLCKPASPCCSYHYKHVQQLWSHVTQREVTNDSLLTHNTVSVLHELTTRPHKLYRKGISYKQFCNKCYTQNYLETLASIKKLLRA